MKISSIILISFSLILLLFSFTTYINFKQAELVDENSNKLTESTLIVRQSNRFQRNFLNMVGGLRGYLLTREKFFIEAYDSAIIENTQILEELSVLVAGRGEHETILADIKSLNQYWIANISTPLLNAKKLSTETDSARLAFERLYRVKSEQEMAKGVQKNLQKRFSDFVNYEYMVRETQKEKLLASIQQTNDISFSLTAFSIIGGACISLFLAYYISSRIVKMVRMADDIASGTYDVHMPESGNSELSQLARALNHMANILNSNITLLKRQKEDLDQFAHIVSHDLKAPLRGIDNVVTWIEEDHRHDLPDTVTEYIGIIKGRIHRAENLLKGILMYSKVGKEQRDREVVDLNQLLREIAEDLPKPPGIRLVVQPDFPVLYTERIPLLQIFTNLIQNALKYHDKESGTVKIYFKPAGDFFQFFVQDDGPGIAAKHHQRIFQIFETLNNVDSVETTGIGLAIVKKILDDRGLSIHLDSAPGQGSTFYFWWPKNEFA